MNYVIAHEIRGRIRFSCSPQGFSARQVQKLRDYFLAHERVCTLQIHKYTGSIILSSNQLSNDALKALVDEIDLVMPSVAVAPEKAMSHTASQSILTHLLWELAEEFFLPTPIKLVSLCLRSTFI